MKRILTMTIFGLAIAIPAQAKKAPPATWQVMRNLDPVTGAGAARWSPPIVPRE